METSVDRTSRHRRARHGVALLAAFAALATLVRASDDSSRAFRIPPEALESADAIRRSVASAAASGFEAILAPASLAPDGDDGFDALGETLKEAAARKLRVHAWLHVGRATTADEIPASRDHVLYQHPEWLMVPRDLAIELMRVDVRSPEYIGRLTRWTRANAARADGIYVSPIHPEAIAYLTGRVTDVLRRHQVNGVHLDALGFPDAAFDYSRRALELFRADVRRALGAAELARMDAVEAIDPFAYPEEFPEAWRAFRQSWLIALTTRVRAAIRTAYPELLVTLAVAGDAQEALRDSRQDWRARVDGPLTDAVAPAPLVRITASGRIDAP